MTPVPAGEEERLAEQLAGWAERHNADTFVVWPSGDDLEHQVERLALVRDAVKGAVR